MLTDDRSLQAIISRNGNLYLQAGNHFFEKNSSGGQCFGPELDGDRWKIRSFEGISADALRIAKV